MKYQKPKLFVPTKEDKTRVANIIASKLSPDKVVVVDDQTKIRGTRKIQDNENNSTST